MKNQLTDLASSMRCEMFASRDTVKEAYEYALVIAKACGDNQPGVLTAIHVMMNSIADEIDRRAEPINELLEAIEVLIGRLALHGGIDSWADVELDNLQRAIGMVKGEQP